VFSVYDTLSPLGQALHSAHVLFSALAAVLATIPLLTDKGSVLQRWGGRIFLALSGLACLIGFGLGLQEHSLLLLAFQVFFLYLLLGGWRAAQLSESGRLITFDIVLIGLLAGLALVMFAAAFVTDDAVRRFYLGFFVLCAAIMAWRDAQRLQKHLAWQRLRRFLGAFDTPPDHWLGRYASMMAGSVIVNLTVVVLSFLPHDWHWLWPVLLLIGSWLLINRRARQRQQQLRELVLWQRH
jgi:hypothetical protein